MNPIIPPPTTLTQPEQDLFAFDARLLDTPIAQRAHYQGLLTAKQSALRQAQLLSATGLVLLAFVLLVSFLHIFHTLASYVPDGVTPLTPPAWLWHTSAALLTISIDAIALYLALIGNVAAFAGQRRSQRLVVFFYMLTGLLNGVFFVAYVPGVPDWITQALDAGFATVIVLLMTLLVPISIVAVKRAMQIAETARLKLTVECATLRGMVNADTDMVATDATPEATRDELPPVEHPTPQPATPPDDTPQTPAVPSTDMTVDLSTLTPDELLALPDSPAVDAEIQRRAAHNTDRLFTWLRQQLQQQPGEATVELSSENESLDQLDHTTQMPSLIGINPPSLPRDENGVILDKVCPACFSPLSASDYGAARRWGHCKHCKNQ